MTYDTIIIGGGPAGLTCAIFLARYRRPVVVLDDGHPRNAPTLGIHGFLGQHGIAPGELLERGRAEALATGAEIVHTRATKVERNADVFEVTTEEGVFSARRLVLAYGVRDTLPDIPEIRSYYGITVHHCPDCDGFECCDQRIGVIGWKKSAVGLALKLLQWSDDVVIFTHGNAREWDEEEHSKLLAECVSVVDDKIIALDGADGILKMAVLENGERVPVQRLYFTIKTERSCTLAEDLGCNIDPEKPVVFVDEHGATTIDGVWAIGDLNGGSQLAITAAADGAVAAIAINKSLLPPSRQV